jgi:hypothetical protein
MSAPKPSIGISFRSDLLTALRMTSVSRHQILVDGVPVAGPGALEEQLPHLAAALYSRWFAQWWPPQISEHSDADEPGIVARLRAAHAATERLTDGWIARAVMPGGAVVGARDGEEWYFESADHVNLTRPAAPVRAGDSIAVTMRRDSSDQNGWWLTWSAAGPAPANGMLRMYWNVSPADVAPLVRGITTVLEDAQLPYTMKCPSAPTLFGRCDGFVVYLTSDGWSTVKSGLREVHEKLAARLAEPTPPLTLRLGRGVALAQDPGNGRSFGETMSWAVAEGVLAVLADGSSAGEDSLAVMVPRLAAAGIDIDRPYLCGGGAPESLMSW